MTIIDVNEHFPQFTNNGVYSATINENIALNSDVITVFASDGDQQTGSTAVQVSSTVNCALDTDISPLLTSVMFLSRFLMQSQTAAVVLLRLIPQQERSLQ